MSRRTTWLRPGQKRAKVSFPELRPSMRAMPVRVRALWNKPKTCGRHALQRCRRHRQVARIDEIIGRVDPGQRRGDPLELRPWIIVSRGVQLVDRVICIE